MTKPVPEVRPWAVLAVAGSAAFMVLLDTQVLFVAFDDLRASFPGDSEPAWATQLLPATLLSGVAVSLVAPHLTSAAVNGLPPDQFGAGAAINQAIRQFGATFGVALTVALLAGTTPLTAVDHYQRVWWVLVGCGVLTSVAALGLPRRTKPMTAASTPITLEAAA